LALGIPQAAVGAWALFAPHGFYADFPLSSRHWISSLGPYNEHLVTDVGAGLLALAALVLLAAVSLERSVVLVALVAWLVFAVPHLVFHVAHTDGLGTGDNVANLVSLGATVLVPLVLLALLRGGRVAPDRNP
jgi:hypothetical protein